MAFLIVLLVLVVVIVALFAIAPYHIYTLTLTEGVNTRFLVMKPSPKVFFDGLEFDHSSENKNEIDDSSLFKYFHFSNFLIPFPFNHPQYSMIPNIKIEATGPRLGASFLDEKNSELLSIMLEKNYKLETTSGEQKLFLLPLFRNYIAKKTDDEIWKDLFSKKLSLPSNVGKSFIDSLLMLKNVSYNELVYNLYILYNRNHLFPKNTEKILFDFKNGNGLIELPSDDIKYKLEKLMIVEKGVVYSVLIKTKLGEPISEHFRNKLIKEIKYKSSNSDSAIPIYAEYKNISYNHRIDQQGMTYLYAAWSHDLGNRDYIRVIILFLERGKLNLKFLKPFYEYAYKRFGSNLSNETDYLLETPEEKLKRKIKNDLESEIKTEEEKNNSKFEGKFSSPDDKIKYYLQKAKENKTNADDSEKVLIQE